VVTQREPASKPRSGLTLTVFDDEAPQYRPQVVYGTSQRVNGRYAGEFAVTPNDAHVFKWAGLSYPTGFNFTRSLELPCICSRVGMARANAEALSCGCCGG
jgi:hypothetical protein